MDSAYGMCMVVLHAILLGSVHDEPAHSGESEASRGVQGQTNIRQQQLRDQLRGGGTGHHAEPGNDSSWFFELLDLNIGWGHGLSTFHDSTMLLSGLIYGVVIMLICGYMFHAVQTHPNSLPTTSRWFVAFMNLQLILYLGFVLAKLPNLCVIQEGNYPLLEMDCGLLHFVYIEQVAIAVMEASLSIWIFSSFVFALTVGLNPLVDKPEFAMDLDMHDTSKMPTQQSLGPGGPGSMGMHSMGMGMPNSMAKHQSFGAGPSSQSMAAHQSLGTRNSLAPASRHSFAASQHSMGAGRQGGSLGHGASMAPAHQSMQGGHMSMGQNRHQSMQGDRPSYNIGSRMPRASSSAVTTTTVRSHDETQALIKPPVAVF